MFFSCTCLFRPVFQPHNVLSLGPTACDCDATLCDCFRLQLTRDLCDCFNYFFSTNIIADQSPTSRRTIGDRFCMPSAIDRRLVAVGLHLVKSDWQPVGQVAIERRFLIKCYEMDEFISVQVHNMIIQQQIQLLCLQQNDQNANIYINMKTSFRCSWHCKLLAIYYLLATCRRSVAVSPVMPASVAQLDGPSDCKPRGRGFNSRRGRQHSFVEIDYEIFSTIILSLPLIQEGQLSVSGERMCTILVNRLED